MNKNTIKIIFQVNAKVICDVLNVPEIFPVNVESLSEETLVKVFRECKSKVKNIFFVRGFKRW